MKIRPLRKYRRAASILAILALVTVLSFLAMAMCALFMQGLHFSQGAFNGDVAMSQAESGLHEVLYRLGQDEACSYGQAGQSFKGSMSRDFPLSDSYYEVTFDRNSGRPFSTNNIDGSQSLGYLNRAVGEGCVHVLVTGFCRGQYRCIEAVVRRPDSAYGIASSGKIVSASPLMVYGTSTVAQAENEEYRRPGHIVSNSAEGVSIGRPPGTPADVKTDISGFIQSVGPISLAEPAVVKSGLRPHASALEIPRFQLQGELNPAGLPGTVNIVELTHGPQDLDVIYYSGHDLTFTGPVNLHNAYLYVKGKLVVNGGISGVGAVLVDGDVEVNGGTDLSGSNSLALISSGKVTLSGASNYFQGFVYGEKGLVARNLTVVGSLILRHPTGSPEPSMSLDHVTVVNTQSAANVSFTASSYSYTSTQAASDQGNYLSFSWDNWKAQTGYASAGGGPIYETELPGKLKDILVWNNGGPNAGQLGGNLVDLSKLFINTNGGGPSVDGLLKLNADLQKLKATSDALKKELDRLNQQKPRPVAAIAQKQAELDAALQTNQTRWGEYVAAATNFANAYTNYVRTHSASNGSRRLRPGAPPTDVTRVVKLDLNSYLPAADRLHVSFCRVINRLP